MSQLTRSSVEETKVFVSSPGSTNSVRQLRQDAERNRQRIAETAWELFRERGSNFTLLEVARHAGVGGATVYRHFPHKDRLTEFLIEQHSDECAALLEINLVERDSWHELQSACERVLELCSANRGLREVLLGSSEVPDPAGSAQALRVSLASLTERVVAADLVRPGVTGRDFEVILMMVAGVMDAVEAMSPESWRRYLQIAMDGLRLGGAPLEPVLVANPIGDG
jgi:AcrR family transcriptional regulator